MPRKFDRRTKTPHTKVFDESLRKAQGEITVEESQKLKRLEKIKKKGAAASVWAADKSGCSWWRLEMPRLAMHYGQRADIQMMSSLQTDVKNLAGFDTFIVQRHMLGIHLEHMDFLKKIADLSGASLVFDIDDICVGEDIPHYNAMRDGYQTPELEQQFKEAVHTASEMHVCSRYMADYYSQRLDYDRVTVVPNMPLTMWAGNFYDAEKIEKNYYTNRKRPRVGWVGSATHVDVRSKHAGKDDFSHITDMVIKTINRFKWVFFGAVPNRLEPYVKIGQIELYPWVDMMKYPAFYSGLNLQAVIAPLADNHFNRAKSNIKWTEAGLLGINGAFQDFEPYAEAKYRFSDGAGMVDHLDEILHDDTRFLSESAAVRQETEEGYLIEQPDNMDLIYSSFFTQHGSPTRRMASSKLTALNPDQF